ncbi:putative reductase [compost metagenome]
MYGPRGVVADGNRLIRMDDHELDPAIQAAVSALWSKVTPDNFHALGDFAGLRRDFMQLNGFELAEVDYGAPVNESALTELTP